MNCSLYHILSCVLAVSIAARTVNGILKPSSEPMSQDLNQQGSSELPKLMGKENTASTMNACDTQNGYNYDYVDAAIEISPQEKLIVVQAVIFSLIFYLLFQRLNISKISDEAALPNPRQFFINVLVMVSALLTSFFPRYWQAAPATLLPRTPDDWQVLLHHS